MYLRIEAGWRVVALIALVPLQLSEILHGEYYLTGLTQLLRFSYETLTPVDSCRQPYGAAVLD